jgi:hypothetical protein
VKNRTLAGQRRIGGVKMRPLITPAFRDGGFEVHS